MCRMVSLATTLRQVHSLVLTRRELVHEEPKARDPRLYFRGPGWRNAPSMIAVRGLRFGSLIAAFLQAKSADDGVVCANVSGLCVS